MPTTSPRAHRQPWNNWYHSVGHTYGSWLPGDPRGFRTRHHREHVEGDYKSPPPPREYEGLHQHAQSVLKRPPVEIATKERELVARHLAESLLRRNVELVVLCVDALHFHLLARFPERNPRHWIGIAKKESSHFVGRALWGKYTIDVPIKDRAHQLTTVRYIRAHKQRGAAVWFKGQVEAP